MAETERTRSRERERPTQSAYEVAVTYDRERTERQMMGRVVLRLEDCPQEQTRQGLLRPYLDPFVIHRYAAATLGRVHRTRSARSPASTATKAAS